MTELTTPVGRLVSGHPMVSHAVTDDKTGLPKMQRDNVTPQVNFYCGLAIQKGNETDWRQTEWGQLINNVAIASWPNGEHSMAAFSWKIVDGDSQVPNKKMKKPCDNEGWPGHWIIHASNGFPITCYHRNKYDPQFAIQRKEEIKTGDYCRMVLNIDGNKATGTNTPGIYVNPSLFELYQAGIEIITGNMPDANATFGASQGVLPQGAAVDAGVGSPPPPVQPHSDILLPPPPPPEGSAGTPVYVVNGVSYTREALAAGGYTPEQIAALPTA